MSETFLALMSGVSPDPRRISIIDERGKHRYGALWRMASGLAHLLLEDRSDLAERRVALLAPSGFEFVAALLAIWQAGGTAVPLCLSHPARELEYVMADASVEFLFFHPNYQNLASSLVQQNATQLLPISGVFEGESAPLPLLTGGRDALVLYTSGTTSRPKGALSTHSNLTAQIETLVEAWAWSRSDRILHVLPLYHTHGLINALLCPLRVGARCEMLPSFDTATVWERFSKGEVSVFMAVPTIYVKLIEYWEEADRTEQARMSREVARLRLMVSGSAALPRNVFQSWARISGQPLLERYGMTEIGMALSNPLHGERRPGSVGTPLPGVEIRLVDESGRDITTEGQSGEVLVRGPSVFKKYLGKPKATSQAFSDGWFRTGDQALVEQGYYRILGRISQDIIKSGGYKVSALEIEEVLGTHPLVRECAVVGIPDDKWGERVAVALSLRSEDPLSLGQLRGWASSRLANYKIPSRMILVEKLPRNAMGKIVKSELTTLFD